MNDEHQRRTALRQHAARALLDKDKAKATRDILKWAARLVEKESSPALAMMGDLKAVMIGDGYMDPTGRGTGPYYVGSHTLLQNGQHLGSEGFRHKYKDSGFQVHHVFAAILMGRWPARIGTGVGWWGERGELEKILDSSKVEHHDIRVYDDFCPLGRATNDHNYHTLADRVFEMLAAGDEDLVTNPPNFHVVLPPPPPVEFLTGVRERLKRLQFYSGPINGPFDAVTKNAVLSFQRANPPLVADGIPGPKTQARLKAVYGS